MKIAQHVKDTINMVRIICISDTHNKHNSLGELPGGDILIHAGDLSFGGREDEVKEFFEWLSKQSKKYKYVVFTAGNHDRSFDPKFNGDNGKPNWLIEELNSLPKNVYYLENESVELMGLSIWGSPITPWFHGDRWAFNKHRGEEIAKVWAKIPEETDIVITHGPVNTKLDYVPRSTYYAGCVDLRERLEVIKPILHVCGHIHEGYGVTYNEDTTYINASVLTIDYEQENHPIVVDIDTKTKKLELW